MKKKKGTNVYEKKVSLGRLPDGTPVRKSITGRTIAELNQRVEDAKQKWMEMNAVTDGVLFSTYARKWLSTTKAVKSLNTKAMYENIIEKHLIPEIGDLYFGEITLADLQKIINNRSDRYNTCSKIKLTLKQIYESAIAEKLADDVKVKMLVLPPKTKTEKRPLTPDEISAIFNADFTPEQEMFVKLLYYTGLRREEILALHGHDITNAVSVVKVIVFDKNTAVIKNTPKSAAGTRTVPIPDSFTEIIDYAHGRDILFPMPTDPAKYMTQSSYTKFWQGIVTKLKPLASSADTLTAHIFRHNYATMLYYSNISIKKAAALMGHNNVNMIMQVYAHLDEMQERTTDKLNDMFKKRTPRSSPGHPQ